MIRPASHRLTHWFFLWLKKFRADPLLVDLQPVAIKPEWHRLPRD